MSNKTQLVLYIRWVDSNLIPHEDLIGLYVLDKTGADTITVVINDALLNMKSSLRRCCGQNYDGCSTMQGKKNGLAKQIKDEELLELTAKLMDSIFQWVTQ